MPFLRKYGVATASGTHIGIQLPKAGLNDYATGSDWTPATGDVKISIDGGAEANITSLPAYTNGWWIFQFTIAELTGKSIRVKIVDSPTKAVDDQAFIIETFGDASALYQTDFTASLATLANQTTAATNLARLLGLAGDNSVLDDTTYDASGNITAGNIYVYDTKAHATTHDKATGLLYKYSITNTASGGNVTLGKTMRET